MRTRLLSCVAAVAVGLAALPSSAASHEDDETASTTAEPSFSALLRTAMNYQQTLEVVADLNARAQKRDAAADAAEAEADKQTGLVVAYMTSLDADPFSAKVQAALNADDDLDFVDYLMVHQQVTDYQQVRLEVADRARAQARDAREQADDARFQADAASQRAQKLVKQMGDEAEALNLGQSNIDPTLPATHEDQEARDRAARTTWRAYQDSVAGLDIPSATKLRNPAALPPGFTPVRAAGKPVPGVATTRHRGEDVTVLPEETMTMIDAVLDRLGEPYLEDSYTCTTVLQDISGAYGLTGDSPADLYASTVKVPTTSRQPGDLLFFADTDSGIHHVGLYLGGDVMIDAAATRYSVNATRVPDGIWAVTRPALGDGDNRPPAAKKKTPPTVCNATKPTSPAPQGLRMPMKEGTYRLSAHFGQAGKMWSSGHHTGQDFSAPLGTPIYAAHSGTVDVRPVSWAGNLIEVTRPDGTVDAYAHTSKQLVDDGQKVQVGQKIAEVGSEGNSTGPHLHFEIIEDGVKVDPMPQLLDFLPNRGAEFSWGGYANGQIPTQVLCPTSDDLALRCDAADGWETLTDEFTAQTGQSLTATRSYEALADQVRLNPRDGQLEQYPGTSPFGWGLRVQLENTDAEAIDWLTNNATGYGWTLDGHVLAWGDPADTETTDS